MEYMTKLSKGESDLCLYSHIQISFREKIAQGNTKKQLLRVHPSFKKGDTPIEVSEYQKELQLTLTFSSPYVST
jgi:hypothetical protein